MATTRFYLDCRSKAKDGKGNIIITLFHNYSTCSFPTGIRISPDEWKNDRVVKHHNAAAYNAYLAERKAKIDKMITILALDDPSFETMTAAQVKSAISENGPVRNRGHQVSSVFTEYLSHNMSDSSRSIYKILLKKMLDFGGKDLKMESVTYKWVLDFDTYMAKTQKINGRAVYLRGLRAICNYARKIGAMTEYPFDNFKIRTEPTIKRSVDLQRFQEFMSYPTSPMNARYRDYFMLIFLLVGINTKDLLLAKKEQVVDGRLEYIRAKTHKKYSIKIEPEAQALLDKYAGKNYLLEAMDNRKSYKTFLRRLNEHCKEIGPTVVEYDELFGNPIERVEPIVPEVSTYFARHSWATFAYEIGIPIEVISKALGHPIGNPTTWIYIKSDRSQIDRANRAVIDYVFGLSSLESPSLL